VIDRKGTEERTLLFVVSSGKKKRRDVVQVNFLFTTGKYFGFRMVEGKGLNFLLASFAGF
jgi:hypothetical protein